MKQTLNITLFTLVTLGIFLGVYLWNREDTPTLPPTQSTEGDSLYTIIAFGDSLTAGYGLPLSDSYPSQLEVRLRETGVSVKVINSGVSGETTRGNLERAAFIRSQNPSIVLLGIGGNDALRLLPIEETEANMRATIETLRGGENPPVVILLQMQAPINVGLAYKQKFDSLYETLSDEYNIPLVPFITKEVFLNPDYKLDDGIHLNRDGYAFVVGEYILPEVENLLGED